ncbi:uncharacterized protein J3R85_000037 [Psidium guajava]|nr:uncharacterized protein J3R85_000037 [Psidium guajava]
MSCSSFTIRTVDPSPLTCLHVLWSVRLLAIHPNFLTITHPLVCSYCKVLLDIDTSHVQ